MYERLVYDYIQKTTYDITTVSFIPEYSGDYSTTGVINLPVNNGQFAGFIPIGKYIVEYKTSVSSSKLGTIEIRPASAPAKLKDLLKNIDINTEDDLDPVITFPSIDELPQARGDINLNNHSIINVKHPERAGDATNKEYVDTAIEQKKFALSNVVYVQYFSESSQTYSELMEELKKEDERERLYNGIIYVKNAVNVFPQEGSISGDDACFAVIKITRTCKEKLIECDFFSKCEYGQLCIKKDGTTFLIREYLSTRVERKCEDGIVLDDYPDTIANIMDAIEQMKENQTTFAGKLASALDNIASSSSRNMSYSQDIKEKTEKALSDIKELIVINHNKALNNHVDLQKKLYEMRDNLTSQKKITFPQIEFNNLGE